MTNNISSTEQKHLALNLADKINLMLSNEMVSQSDPYDVYEILKMQHESFYRAFPMILSKMVFERRYNRNAFERFLNGMAENPGKGMEGVAHHQALYVKYLYEEECKENHIKPIPNTGKQIYETEYNIMYKEIKKIKQDEKKARSEYEDELKKHDKELRDEFYEFLEVEYNNIENIDDLYIDKLDEISGDDDTILLEFKNILHKDNASTVQEPEPISAPDPEPEPIIKKSQEEISRSFIAGTSTEKFFMKKRQKRR